MDILDPRGLIGRIYVRTTKHCYIQNKEAVGLLVSEKIFLSFSHYKSMGARSCGPPGFREDFFKVFLIISLRELCMSMTAMSMTAILMTICT